MRRRRYLALAVGGAVATAGCPVVDSPIADDDGETDPATDAADGVDGADDDRTVASSPLEADLQTTVAMQDLELPWDVAFAEDGDGGREVFLTERPGRIRRGEASVLTDGEREAPDALPEEPVELPMFISSWEAGAQGIALHPDYPDAPWVYVYYTAGDPDDDVEEWFNRVVRYDATDDDREIEVLVDEIPGSHIHNGGRIAFGPDDRLWILAGTGGDQDLARDPTSLGGAVLRIDPDGDPAGAGVDGWDPRTVSHGHRNPQGIDWLPDGTPLVAEHGPAQRDELHLLEEGADHGWEVARGGDDDPQYDSYPDHDFARPVASSGQENTWAPSGGSVYDAEAIPGLRGRFLLGGLVSKRLHVFTLLDPDEERPPGDAAEVHDDDWLDDAALAVRHERFEGAYGRLRHAAVGPDGAVYLLTSNTTGPIDEEYEDEFPREHDDVIVRVEPA